MGKGRPRAVEKGVLGQNTGVASTGTLNIPLGPVYYPSEEEFKDPLEYIYKIRPEAEAYGICKIVPPKSWKPPFALNLDSFTFPTKTQAIHQLQARPASCDSKTFELEYNRFLEDHCSRKLKKKVVFEGEDLDLCKLFNAVKRFGGYNKVVKEKKWGEVSRFVRSGRKISECAKHVLCQLYREHLYDYENYQYKLNKEVAKGGKRGMHEIMKSEHGVQFLSSKRRRKNGDGEKVKVSKLEEEELDQVCEQCKSGLHGEVMLLCDRCNKGWHIYCLSPPLKHIPPGNWYCLECLNSDKDSFGFVPGKQLALEAFRRVADRATRKWFGAGPASRVQIEKRFWDIVEGSAGEVEVMYGSDLDTSLYGSGFPRVDDQRPESVEVNVWDEYCCSPWNLNNLPKLEGSMLRAVHNNITGVMVPWLYVGMLFSSFCWHFEDHCFYSMNYLHWGEPKCWYSVPGSEANSFEKVMRDSLPDLFDAQPDLLFQLVTMLNPSVLQKNGVPVYTVLQEPGNFVITFPRSFHGGFNFGLNCAEAVNFAPADWLPHGGYGAKLYKQYHKSAVISHEELLCVVAKFQSHFNSRVSPHLKKELLRIYANEKTWRERLWRSGIMKSSPMSARKCPEYVGTEEDPTCIICQQYLYLSAVVCRCRPSTFVCLEHWEHLCECKPWKLRLLYRHSLAELYELVLAVDKYDSELPQEAGLQRHSSCSNQLCSLTKKVKGGRVTLSQLAEQWLLRSSKILQDGFSSVGYAALLKEAEQFLWAGREMEPVRSVAKRLTEAKKWGEDIRDCVSKIENWSYDHPDLERVHLEHVKELLSFNPVPCSEPLHLKLKDYAEEASRLAQEIDAALSNCTSMSELELLYSRAGCLPVYVKETEKLLQKISSGKVWIDSARKCISDKRPAGVELDLLYMLKSEILELQVQLPETEMILDLLRQAESCRARCTEILNGSIDPKIVKLLLQELAGFAVNVLELELLKQYQSDTALWVARCNSILVNVHEREDQQNVVDELTSLLNEGRSLRIQVDELPLVEVELKKACCREKALKARGTKMSLDFVKQLMSEAVVLQIDGEKLFVDISGVLEAAMQWEERATSILAHKAQMFEFEDLIRMSEDIFVDLPSLDLIQDAVLVGKSWLKNSKPFLVSALPMTGASSALLEVDVLKELVSQAKSLKVSFEEKILLGRVLKNCEDWEQDACSLLQNADTLLDIRNINNAMDNSFISKIESLVTRMESAKKSGLSSGCDFHEIPKLENACSKLQWCNKVLSFYSSAPSYKDVEGLMETAEHLSITSSSGLLWGSLVNGVKWLKRVLDVVSLPCNFRRCKLSDAEEVLAQSQDINISFPVMIRQLENAIREHKLWQEKVHHFFSLKFEERSWSLMLQLKECGKAAAFNCSELDMVLSEVEKVEKWKQSCINIVGMSVRDTNPLLGSLRKIKQSLGISLQIYDKSRCSKVIILCMCSDSGSANHPFLTCLTCKDCYHLECLGQAPVDKNYAEQYICPYCQVSELGSVSQKGGGPLKFEGKRPDIKSLIELLSDAENFTMGIEERNTLQEVVEQALACNACVAELVDFTSSYLDKDLSIVSRKLTMALKAIDIAGVYDHKASSDVKMALAKNSWRVRVSKLQEGSPKPTIKQIQHLLKEGLAMNIPPEDHFLQRLSELKHNGLQWAERARKVVADSGALALDQVFELINEGENLPVYFAKELKSLEARSMLHCICRKPLDERRMIACDWCGEWYHTNCVKVPSPTKVYICAACYPRAEQLVDQERSRSTESVEPKTPSPQHTISRKKQKRAESSLTQKMLTITNSSIILRNRIDCLWWRNRKPFRRATRKRADLDNLSPFSHIQ